MLAHALFMSGATTTLPVGVYSALVSRLGPLPFPAPIHLELHE